MGVAGVKDRREPRLRRRDALASGAVAGWLSGDPLACSKIYGYAVAINTDRKSSRRRRFTPAATPAQQTDSLREGIYVTFTALSVTLVVASHPGTPVEALLVLLVTTTGTVVAALTADVLSHLAVHDRFLNGPELRHALRASLGSLVTVVAPLVLLGASALGAWPVTPALRVSAAALLATLVTVAAVAIRGIRVPWWQRTLFLLTLGVAGLLVVWLQTLAHG
ncbi:hypothetical protein AB0B57_04640 [Micromonospora sp. NPDC049101]|uniref:hypothetical protein n=1 Tax=unclassified Micromonospora TaxID=2617518 RepID=UPI0034024170